MSLVKPAAAPTPKSPEAQFSDGLPFQSTAVSIDATNGISNAKIATVNNPWAHQGTISWTLTGATFAETNGIAFNEAAPFVLTRVSDTEYQAAYVNDTLSQIGTFPYTITTAAETRDDPTVENDPPGEPYPASAYAERARGRRRSIRRRRPS
jgi:hypothetical protein